jgi:PAS domain S-box-containing protein
MVLFNTGVDVSAVVVDRTLPPHPTSPGAARRLVAQALRDADLPDLDDSCRMAVSELVTNALVHAGTDLRVAVRVEHGCVRVEVHDGSPHLPVRREYSSSSGTGRGLGIVADLVDDWGAYRVAAGKVVWFLLYAQPQSDDRTQDARRGDPAEPVEPATAADSVAVELRDFPLLMHAAWQEHCSALLREFLLVSITGADEPAAFQRHAQASDALNVLYEQVPAPEVGEDPQIIMIAATEPHVTAHSLVVSIPRDSVRHFETLDAMLTEAGQFADGGRMLVAPTQPEIRDLRTWLCSEVRTQAVGAAPRPWRYSHTGGAGQREYLVPAGWDPSQVTASDRALLATNQESVIVAASAAAAELLGYASHELLGRRVLTIIPARYHQAHIAGTTLHMANGRGPLLNKRITVPVTRADGTEVTLALEVRLSRLADGHRVFIAELGGEDTPQPQS